MKTPTLACLTTGLISAWIAIATPTSVALASSCPKVDLGETPEDCPWADITRSLESAITSGEDLETVFQKIAPRFLDRIETEAKLHQTPDGYKSLWGKSLNFDEGAKSIIIKNPIIDFILKKAGVESRNDRIVHAGFEHTYGYLLSNLSTPYGYKRARWVKNDIEMGFGIPRGLMGPMPQTGGLFSNVTYFAGSIAFRNDPETLKIIQKGPGVSPLIRSFDFTALQPTRLSETVELNGRIVTLRTDIVPFTGPAGVSAEVLIYSIKDSSLPHPYLISMFPVAKGFRNGVFNPKNLGLAKPIHTRYNAFVADVTDSKNKLTGERKIEKESTKK